MQIGRFITERKYLLALQAIKDEVDPGDYQELLNQNFNEPVFEASKLHEIIFALDSRLVITTNFDKIYEKHCLNVSTEGFKVIPYNSTSLADELRSDTRLIIKAHGSIDEISAMIFTRGQYHSAKRDNPGFYGLLKAIFLLRAS
ncbi:SIR2 family protein [Methylocystis sp. IM2]|uniref:SIR2 family protein n=1 Tax=unclassified Methylocystis TaxID=2625913 RepID=UPI004047A740